MKLLSSILLLHLSVFLLAQKGKPISTNVVVADTPTIYLPFSITAKYSVRDMAISAAGDEMFYTLLAPDSYLMSIVYCKKQGAKWKEPVMASFSGQYSDLEPAFSPDGKKIFFASNRPLKKGDPVKDFDIWYVENRNGQLSEPVNAGAIINTDGDEFYPAVTKSGNIYYTAAYADSKGKEDIYVSEWKNGAYQKPYSLSDSVNSKTYDFNAYVSPDEDLILFSSQGRVDDTGGGDLYISMKDKSGNWKKAVHLPAPINSTRLDYCPYLSPDKKIFYFTSNRSVIQQQYDSPLTIKQLTGLLAQPGNGKGNLYTMSGEKIMSFAY
ncbi:MAG: hypothetical protein ABUT20_49715 [Bacteroidota bacterium]